MGYPGVFRETGVVSLNGLTHAFPSLVVFDLLSRVSRPYIMSFQLMSGFKIVSYERESKSALPHFTVLHTNTVEWHNGSVSRISVYDAVHCRDNFASGKSRSPGAKDRSVAFSQPPLQRWCTISRNLQSVRKCAKKFPL